ncbi:MAG TPA: copper resistance CopC family protein [Burkholderiales bacterium]|nr:copper resistance CopC family protein [Burkholderiales bacterium]HUK04914.1 copper resistance CopC family protein [Burkholderiales bacterium]
MSRWLGFLFAAAACLAATAALAHAYLDRTVPEAGSTVHGSPAEVRLWFSHALEPAFSTVRVVDRGGRQVDLKDKQAGAGETKLLKVSLPALPPGPYRVIWRVLSADGHVTRGEFGFEVAP